MKAEVLRKPQKAIQRKNDLGHQSESLRPANRFPWFQKNSPLTGKSVNNERLTPGKKCATRCAKGRAC